MAIVFYPSVYILLNFNIVVGDVYLILHDSYSISYCSPLITNFTLSSYRKKNILRLDAQFHRLLLPVMSFKREPTFYYLKFGNGIT